MIQALELLISRGHDKNAVLFEYSIDEVMLFARAALMNKKLELADLLIGMRMTTSPKNKVFAQYIESLTQPVVDSQTKRSSRNRIAELAALSKG